MKYLYILLFATIFTTAISWSQTSPLDPVCTFNYQGVIRNDDFRGLFEKEIRVQFSILDGPAGNALYIEQHETTTNSLGLFVLEIGGGDRVDGTMLFEVIPWAIRKHYLKVEVDTEGGTDFEEYGVSPFLAVPIAVEAKIAAFAVHTLDTITCYDTLKVKQLCADSIKATSITTKTICADSTKSEVVCASEIKAEKLSVETICVDEIKINDPLGGNPFPFVNADPLFGGIVAKIDRIEGELTAERINADKIHVGDVCATDVNLKNNATGEITNVLKTDFLTEDVIARIDILTGCVQVDTLKVKHIVIEGDGGGDSNPQDELQTLSKQGDQISLSQGGGSILLNDDSPTNELQEISKGGNQIALSDGGNIVLLDDDPQNELQNLSLENNELRLSGSAARIRTDEFSPWSSDGNRLQTEKTITGAGLEVANESVVIEDSKISLRYPNGADALVLDVDGDFGPSITFMNSSNEIIGSIKSDGEGGLQLFSNNQKPSERANLPPDGELHGTVNLRAGEASVALNLPAHIKSEQLHIILTPRSGDSKGLAVSQKSAGEFKVKELFQGSGNYAFDYSVRILPTARQRSSNSVRNKSSE